MTNIIIEIGNFWYCFKLSLNATEIIYRIREMKRSEKSLTVLSKILFNHFKSDELFFEIKV